MNGVEGDSKDLEVEGTYSDYEADQKVQQTSVCSGFVTQTQLPRDATN